MNYYINDNCIGCTLCAKNCPVRAISGAPKQKHSIDQSLCVSCGLCGRLCAKGAVMESGGKPAQHLERSCWQHPDIDTGLCSGCSMCVENCPAFCLALTSPTHRGDTHTVAALADKGKCIGCGICEKSCPLGAIEMK